MLGKYLLICSLFITFGQIYSVVDPKVVCYYEYWFHWHDGDGKMDVEDVDSSLCTHIVYGYQGIDRDSTIKLQDTWLMVEQHDLDKFSKAKGKAQALVAIGGYTLAGPFRQVVSTDVDRRAFTRSLMSFLTTYNFDGVMIDWTGIQWSENLVTFLKLIHTEFAGKYTLGMTLPASIPAGFKSDRIDSYVDLVAVQTYDFHGSWELIVGLQAPVSWQTQVLNDWFKNGFTMNKLLMTIPLYGHTWVLDDPSKTDPGAKATGPGKAGPWSQLEGKLGYNEICYDVKKDPIGWKVHRDDKEMEIYMTHGSSWITFEDNHSCELKTNRATTVGYGGVVVQALSNDDYRGLCGPKYPLLKAIQKGLNKDPVVPPTHPPTSAPPTPDPTANCTHAGLVKDRNDCHIYHNCEEIFPGIYSDTIEHCKTGEGFDEKTLKCIEQKLIPGCH